MVEIDHKIVITGIICLTIIYISLLYCKENNDVLGTMIVGAIALAIGIVIPTPKVDNNRGVFKW